MKVVERKDWNHEYTCGKCGSKLVAEADDVRYGRHGCYDDFETRYYVTCVVCGENHYLKESALPPRVITGATKE